MKPSPYQILARYIALNAVRNSILENYHAGVTPVSKTGDNTDVAVVTPFGTIPWNETSRLSDPELRAMMLHVETGITKCLQLIDSLDDPHYQDWLARLEQELFGPYGVSWDRPEGARSTNGNL